jgi:NADPH:quinone reductase-like Zn-dependent oxidoreductase
MKAWLLKNFGLQNLQMGEVPTPTPKDSEILIRVNPHFLFDLSL